MRDEEAEGLPARQVLEMVPPDGVPLAAEAWVLARRSGAKLVCLRAKYGRAEIVAHPAQPGLDALEEIWSHLCEVCGRYGRLRQEDHWLRCLCPRHWEALQTGENWRYLYREAACGDEELDEIAAHLEAGGDWQVG